MAIKNKNSVTLCPCATPENAVDALTILLSILTKTLTTTMVLAKLQLLVAPMPLHATTTRMRRKTTVLA